MTKKKQMIEKSEIEDNVIEEPIDPKKQILLDFKEYWDANCAGHSIAKMEVGAQIWEFWKRYTDRTDRFNNCAACVFPKIIYLKSESARYGIEIK